MRERERSIDRLEMIYRGIDCIWNGLEDGEVRRRRGKGGEERGKRDVVSDHDGGIRRIKGQIKNIERRDIG